MYCPNCGQAQISSEMRFCSRCGLALSGLAEWLATDQLTARKTEDVPVSLDSPCRRGMRRGAKLMFFSLVLLPIFLVLSIFMDEGAVMFVPCILFFISMVLILYARLFSDKATVPIVQMPVVNDSAFGSNLKRASLTAAINSSMPPIWQTASENKRARPTSQRN